ncbi:unnamed protein product [Musa hybrid cultivar]
MPVKLDAGALTRIEKNRNLQEDLTDDMVGLARQLKESSLLMVQSLQDTEKSFLQWIAPEVFNFRYCNHSISVGPYWNIDL